MRRRHKSKGTSMTQEALKLALEALEELYNTNNYWWQEVDEQTLEKIKHSITAIKEALAQTQEPFAWAEFDGEGGYYLSLYENNETYAEDWNKRNPNHIGWVEPIYKHPPQRTWVGLTDEDKHEIELRAGITEDDDGYIVSQVFKLTEAKLKEKNT